MATLESVQSALNIANTLMELCKTGSPAARVAELREALLDVKDKSLDLQQERQALEHKVMELEDQLREYERFDLEQADYEDHAFPSGAWVVIEKPIAQRMRSAGDSVLQPKYFCQACFERRKRSILQPEAKSQPRKVFMCHLCNLSIPYDQPPRMTVEIY
ncbi:hypothetical protein [Kushneria phosphatilytica]|uniref:Uncharacterized protein n=1 Tax=Kushneria phosphatilytica TaxID=657387 RepID=A0A1S1NQW1_9GAMM|nr:hypothetical protein [Kushneria phosphatilytica]OHV11179.1 hypothetical protein BH688_07585 [Kushneria phosphatilytica]QEL12252.1 hypothetical protein FY550_14645 [Kushneria phosphatilytica]